LFNVSRTTKLVADIADKVSHPQSLSDFRPICVTPILSRVAEKIVVRKWLHPSILSSVIADQFAFKPTVAPMQL